MQEVRAGAQRDLCVTHLVNSVCVECLFKNSCAGEQLREVRLKLGKSTSVVYHFVLFMIGFALMLFRKT